MTNHITTLANLKSKLPTVGTTIFTVMSKLAAETGAINLSQGFPGFDCSPELVSLVEKYLRNGFNQYAPMTGVPALREALAQKTADQYGVNYDPETEITVTSGATEAIFAAVTAVVRPGDEVLVFEPAYDSYVPAIDLNGGIPVYVTLTPPDYSIDWQAVREKITDKTRLILVNTPHNPSGHVWTTDDLDQLANLIRDRDIWIVSDEVYEHILFDGRIHNSLMTHPELRERTFIIGSFGKTFHITGWKIGYCLAPKELSTEFRKIHQYLTFSTVTPIQYALADYLKNPDHYRQLPDFYQHKRDLFLAGLQGSRFTWKPAEGSFFQTVSYTAITDEPDYDLAIRLTKEIGVASIPVSVFYHQKNDYKILRFCFAKDDAILKEAAERLRKL
ncbi:aminotransferase class I/II-fold pyridoxal phosphate-dependent enzyme [Spirosoma sp. HMF4905]|uniref:Aminotransferase class I/II-fold pyridoxal phosphate-dependent enzyme n=1 Tax=Spirosoma arboris TaxID=2682092 RepID=A0A7K1SQ62_9BACT|nr:pyridoxal phosphate-dependent aminotransferase [Spirosoma arboris]MVM35917.1 aminotransferase class I/II-fold pyridoxal phosphate-dependent enzyme [Spirosoma arboris]